MVKQLTQILPNIQHRQIIKLYNASNFFDLQAVPKEDLMGLAALVQDFETVVVENHPRLLSSRIPDFAGRLHGQLQVAMGLETADENILNSLNKQMTLADYENACAFLLEHKLSIRTFLLLPPPGVSANDTLKHTIASVQHAIRCGSDVTSMIPLRPGNGIMDWMSSNGLVHLPDLELAMQTFAAALQLPRGRRQRVFLDLWNLEALANNRTDLPSAIQELQRWNREQGPTSSFYYK
ncbi:MAG: radical SAM protein [Planctomycetaceae bacterium]|nr:radical SAM protein [Planctomycetaceae bacterium]